jgi:hypothetical protein
MKSPMHLVSGRVARANIVATCAFAVALGGNSVGAFTQRTAYRDERRASDL